MKTTFYYAILRDVPRYPNCYLNCDADGDPVVHSVPKLFQFESIARGHADKLTDSHGGKAYVCSIQIPNP